MIAIPHAVYDGFFSQAAGADGGRKAHLIDKDQYEEGENLMCRGGSIKTRLPIIDVALTFDNPNLRYGPLGNFWSDDGPTTESKTTFLTGLFQEASYYSLGIGREYLMASIAGRLFRIKPDPVPGRGGSVFEIALERRNRNTIPIAYHLQADIYFISQDGEGAPIIYDGRAARRAGEGEIFTGTVMGYGMGRIILVKGPYIFFGDIFNGHGNLGADMLRFEETLFLNGGFPSALPSFLGQPTAVKFLPQQDTAMGVGECLVFGANGVESFFLSIPREQWQDSGFQRTALLDNGNRGHRNPVVINQDIWFHSDDGWRSFRNARATQDYWAQIPLSTNVKKWIRAETPALLDYGSAIAFDNRLLMTTTPYPNSGKLFHNGLLSIDFDVISSFGQSSKPSWDGHWGERRADPLNGLRCLQLVEGKFNGRKRAFMFALDADNRNVLKEILPEPVGGDSDGPITARWRGRRMEFDTPDNEKSLYQGNIWIEGVSETTTFTPSFRSDQQEYTKPWGEQFTVEPNEINEGEALTIKPGYAPRRDLPKPSDGVYDTLPDERLIRRFYDLQPEIEWTGRAEIRKFRAIAIDELERATAKV